MCTIVGLDFPNRASVGTPFVPSQSPKADA